MLSQTVQVRKGREVPWKGLAGEERVMNGSDLGSRLAAHADFFDDKLASIPPRVYWAGQSDPDSFAKKNASGGERKKKKKNASAGKKRSRPTAQQINKYRVRATLPEMIDQGRFGGQMEDPEPGAVAAAPVKTKAVAVAMTANEAEPSPKVLANAHMSEIVEKLGFVPGSAAKSPAELKQRLALLKDFMKQKNNRPVEVETDAVRLEKKKARLLQKEKEKAKRKTKKIKALSSTGEVPKDSVSGSSKAAEADLAKSDVNGNSVNGKNRRDAEAVDTNQIDFGVFKFSTGKAEPLFKENQRSGRDVALLRKAEAEQEKKKELMKTEDGKRKVEEMEWDKMMAKAQGVKVKDDPVLLKKALKKREKKKVKSQTEWAEKQKKLDEGKKDKQADFLRRQEKNILRRKGKKGAAAPAASLTRKGRAGFEGRKKKLNK